MRCRLPFTMQPFLTIATPTARVIWICGQSNGQSNAAVHDFAAEAVARTDAQSCCFIMRNLGRGGDGAVVGGVVTVVLFHDLVEQLTRCEDPDTADLGLTSNGGRWLTVTTELVCRPRRAATYGAIFLHGGNKPSAVTL